jgi:hypothetical protein
MRDAHHAHLTEIWVMKGDFGIEICQSARVDH